jgi:hypothetical protein
MKSFTKLIECGWTFEFGNQIKKVNNEFSVRIYWKAKFQGKEYESEWSGFKNATDCLNDFFSKILKVNQLYLQRKNHK